MRGWMATVQLPRGPVGPVRAASAPHTSLSVARKPVAVSVPEKRISQFT